MPKQHQSKSFLTKPSPSAPSTLSLSRTATSIQSNGGEKTVNQLIHESRHGQGLVPRTYAAHPTSSIHPSLRAVLDLPPPEPHAPRAGLRGPNRVRRIPGPPPPPSWLKSSRYAPSQTKNQLADPRHTRWRIVEDASILPGAVFPQAQSLQHLVLKSMASNWGWHAEYDHTYLSELTTAVREVFLSYLAIFNEEAGHDPLKILFPADTGRCEDDEVSRLDLGKAIGSWSTVKKIEKEVFFVRKVATLPERETVPETWDMDVVPDTKVLPTPNDLTSSLRFRNLKHISLALKPGTAASVASWQDLLNLANKLPTITSLSIANWPQPTYTPNASTGRHKVGVFASGSSPSIIYGGSDFYTAFDNNWREAASILKTLSRSLYCLKWLDLTGCADWFPALTWQPSDKDEEVSYGPDWTGSWRGLEHLILAVGWRPVNPQTDAIGERQDPSHIAAGLAGNRETNRLHVALSDRDLGLIDTTNGLPQWNVEHEREKYHHRKEVEKYMELMNCARKVAQDLRIIRKESGKSWIHVEFGEDPDTNAEGI